MIPCLNQAKLTWTLTIVLKQCASCASKFLHSLHPLLNGSLAFLTNYNRHGANVNQLPQDSVLSNVQTALHGLNGAALHAFLKNGGTIDCSQALVEAEVSRMRLLKARQRASRENGSMVEMTKAVISAYEKTKEAILRHRGAQNNVR